MKKIVYFAIIALLSFAPFAQADTELPLTATASYNHSIHPSDMAVDGNLSTYWLGRYRDDPWWLRLDCGSSYNLSQISIWWHDRYGARDYDIQSSQDGSVWTNVYTGLSSVGGSGPQTYTLSVTARFIRIYITREARRNPMIYEVKIFTAGATNQPPIAQVGASTTSGLVPLDVQFTGSGQDPDGTIVGYSWNFGDGNTSTEQNPAYTYSNPGTYIATLTVTDDDGATASASVEIIVGETPEPPAEIPQLIRFQARLEDAQGVALDGTFSLTFRLYDTDIGGEPIWEEIQQDIDVEEGILDVELGLQTVLDLPFDKQYWLGVEVESDGEMAPRFKLTTVPYSFKSVQ